MASKRVPQEESAPNEWILAVPSRSLELCVLELLRDQPTYGDEIVTALETLGPLAAGENTVYPLLRRLKADGHLETFAVESPAGPARQYYRVTTKGKQRRAGLEQEWDQLVQAVQRCLKGGVTA